MFVDYLFLKLMDGRKPLYTSHFVRTTFRLFSFWASGPFVARFEFGPRTLSFSFYLFILSVFESLCVSYLFWVNCHFMSNCYLCLSVFSSNHVVSYCSISLVLIFVYVKYHFILFYYLCLLAICVSYLDVVHI